MIATTINNSSNENPLLSFIFDFGPFSKKLEFVLQADQRRRVRNWEAIRKVVNDLDRCKTDAATWEQNDPKLPRIYTTAT